MSTSGSSRVRRSPSTRAGPLKATLPVSSTWGTNKTSSCPPGQPPPPMTTSSSQGSSPSFSSSSVPPPHFGVLLSGLRSPGAVNYRGKCKTLSGRAVGDYSTASMRRTASLDTIYLSGQWPSEGNLYMGNLLVDRSTQTEDSLGDTRKIKHQDSISNEEKLEKFIRHRMQRAALSGAGLRPSSTVSTTTPVVPFYSLLLSEAVASLTGVGGRGVSDSLGQRQKLRSSIEGLNQEIERLVLKAGQPAQGGCGDCQDRKGGVENTPEGHRAPVADLLRQTRSVNTQTPAYTRSSAQSSGPPSRCSGSPFSSAATNQSDSRPPSSAGGRESRDRGGASEDSSPEVEGGRQLGNSPRINKFLAREPPDGCERVCLKFQEDSRKPMVDISEMDYPLKPNVNFQLKPSLGSAFQPLKSTQ